MTEIAFRIGRAALLLGVAAAALVMSTGRAGPRRPPPATAGGRNVPRRPARRALHMAPAAEHVGTAEEHAFEDRPSDWDKVDEASDGSFPASDPPGFAASPTRLTRPHSDWDRVDQASYDSFPASDPPGFYALRP